MRDVVISYVSDNGGGGIISYSLIRNSHDENCVKILRKKILGMKVGERRHDLKGSVVIENIRMMFRLLRKGSFMSSDQVMIETTKGRYIDSKGSRDKDRLVLVMWEDTNIRPGYIGHQHLNDGLMPDVQVSMSAGSGDYGFEVCLGEGVHGKKIKAVKVVVEITGVIQGQKGFGICCLGQLMRLCPSIELWVKK
ncbi:hypothetical protein ACLOJK_018847 [Asimina triloba]